MKPIVKVEDLSKRYRIGAHGPCAPGLANRICATSEQRAGCGRESL